MTVAELCLLAAVILWLATIGLAKGFGWRDYDNARPRKAEFYADGWRARLRSLWASRRFVRQW